MPEKKKDTIEEASDSVVTLSAFSTGRIVRARFKCPKCGRIWERSIRGDNKGLVECPFCARKANKPKP